MSIVERINQDLKTALLGGDKQRALVLRSLKSAILYVEVEQGKRGSGLPEEEILRILGKEAKKRQESADLYVRGGSRERADAELAEKAIIDTYLPKALSETEISRLIDGIVAETGPLNKQTMGTTIAAVKQKAGPAADGGLIARLVKERLA